MVNAAKFRERPEAAIGDLSSHDSEEGGLYFLSTEGPVSLLAHVCIDTGFDIKTILRPVLIENEVRSA